MTTEMSDKRLIIITRIKADPDDIAKALARIFTGGDYDKYLKDCFIKI